MMKLKKILSLKQSTACYTKKILMSLQKQKQKTKTENNKCWKGCGETETLRTVRGSVKWCSTVDSSVAVPQKIRNRIVI